MHGHTQHIAGSISIYACQSAQPARLLTLRCTSWGSRHLWHLARHLTGHLWHLARHLTGHLHAAHGPTRQGHAARRGRRH
jgi:hypothetical protein